MATSILKNRLLIGKVIPSLVGRYNIKVSIPHFVYDEYYKAYFKHEQEFIALDKNGLCQPGDTVLIEKMDKIADKTVSHVVSQLIYKLGDVKDPVTGESVIGDKYRKQTLKTAELYGRKDTHTDFDYDSSPPAGWQEGKRTFMAKPTYRKWHNFKKEDPYALLS